MKRRFEMKKMYLPLAMIALVFESSLLASNVNVDPQREDTNLQREQSTGMQINADKYLQQERTHGIQFTEDPNLQKEQPHDEQFYEDQNFKQERQLNRI